MSDGRAADCHSRSCGYQRPSGTSIPTNIPFSKICPAMYKEAMTTELNYQDMLAVALGEARKGLAEGGIPIGAAIFDSGGRLIGAGHNRRVQHGDPSMHGETDAFRNARAASAATASSFWSRPWRRAGIVAGWSGSLALQRSSWAKAATFREDSTGCARWA